MKRFALLALALVAGGCAARPDWAALRAYEAAEREKGVQSQAYWEAFVVAGEAHRLQENPFTTRAVRADPMPCARAIRAAEKLNLPWPACKPPPAPMVSVMPLVVGY